MAVDAVSGGSWHYVVVGGGSAGCVLANRLSADGRTRVLLLEAGAEAKGLAIRVPALIQKQSTDLNWLYPVEPDASRNGAVDPWNSGRVLGGSSSTNAMLWVRGNRHDYDSWAANGAAGWAYDDVLPFFRRAERFEDGSTPYRGGEGPQRVARTRVDHPLTDAFVAAAVEAGLPVTDDYNAAQQEGVAVAQLNQRRGLRHSAADAYLRPARGRPNLTVETGAFVERILFEGTQAVGVRYRAAGLTKVAQARREVVLSAGAIGSPKVLMLSGIGARDTLTRNGVAVVSDLPGVGQDLQEHAAASVVYEVTRRTLNQDVTPLRLLRHGADFVLRGRGAITSTASHAVAFARLDPSAAAPDIELIFIAFGLSAVSGDAPRDVHGLLRRAMARTGGRAEGRRQVATDSLVTVHAVVLHPRGRGQVVLRSADPLDPPVVRHQLLGDPTDLQALSRGCQLVRKVFATTAMRPFLVGERVPGTPVTSDPAWSEHLRGTAFRLHHPTSTCRMGTDPMAVVDARLRVRGVRSLRVVDASVMPAIPSGNTNAPTIMIAEKGSDLLRADNPSPG